ncbi:MAG: DUF1015 domain-containing protein [bacterium]|nr:DUF1015 domain-containing protein [bacterium]
MAGIRPFRALRFDSDKTGPLDSVITPPFDVIDPETRARLAASSPYNTVHLILPEPGEETDRYQEANRLLDEWVAKGVLKKDDEESYYLLEQTFCGLDGRKHRRRGFFARVRLPEPGEEGVVLGHERTFDRKVSDRLQLTETAQANLGAVFMLYDDPEGALNPFLAQMGSREPDVVADTADGTTQRMWQVAADDRVAQFFEGKTLYIADGHHRFRTACEHRARMRAANADAGPQAYDYALIGLVELHAPGLIVWPTHRLLDLPDGLDARQLLDGLKESFTVEACDGDLAQCVADGPGCTFGLAIQGEGSFVLTLREEDRATLLGEGRSDAWRALDVAVLHRGILEHIMGLPEGQELIYEPRFDAALAAVESGAKQLAFLVKATLTEQVTACADARDPMPEKATYFFPKLPSGAVIHRFV